MFLKGGSNLKKSLMADDENVKNATVHALRKIMHIISTLEANSELSFGSIVTQSSLSRGAVRRLLLNLMEVNLVTQDPHTKRYRLSLRWLTIGSRALEHLELPRTSRPYLQQLRDQTGFTAHLGIMEGNDVVFLGKVEPDQPIRLYTNVGMRAWAPCTAMGKAILSCLNTDEALSYVGRPPWPVFTARTIRSADALIENLAEIRQRGFAVDDEEHREGIRCIAAPIFSPGRAVMAAVSISGLAMNLPPETWSRFGEEVKTTANQLAVTLGL